MRKRKDPTPGPEDQDNLLKRVKKTRRIVNKQFLFLVKKEHTKYFQNDTEISIADTNFLKEEVVSILLESEEIKQIKIIKTLRILKKYLHQFTQPNSELDSSEENDEISPPREELLPEEIPGLLEARAKFIYQEIKKEKSILEIAKTFGLTPNQVRYIYNQKLNQIEYNGAVEPRKRFLLTKPMYDEIDLFLSQKDNSIASLAMIREHLVRVFDLDKKKIALSTISKMLKKLNYSRKRTHKSEPRRNLAKCLQERKHVAQGFLSGMKSEVEMIFIDESSFQHTLIPLYGYSKVGVKCIVNSSTRSENYSVIAAITKERILGYQIFKGSVDACCFGGFIVSLIKNNQELLTQRSKYALFMDNARIHKAEILKPFFEQLNIFYNAPYSPFLNPIEELFGCWKRAFRKKFSQNTVNIVDKIISSAKEIEDSTLNAFFLHTVSFLEDCLNFEPIF